MAAGLGKRAVILTLSRFANYGLMLVSPIILVRLLSVADFGRYREFLLYGSLLQSFASFSINDSLLYFVPKYVDSAWRIVRQTALLVAASSIAVISAVAVTDAVAGGTLLGGYRLPLALYVLLFINVDFWEAFLLARDEPLRMFAYTAGRLLARMLVVVGLAAATGDVRVIIWGLVALEAVRIAISVLVWRLVATEQHEPGIRNVWREQLQFCVPAGIAVFLAIGNGSLGNIVVAKAIGAAALAQFTIGTYGEPIINAVRNSISQVLLPEMVRKCAETSQQDALRLWKSSTVVNCILLLPCVVLVFRFAEPLIMTVFGGKYLPAVPVLQTYVFVIIRSCFDFSPPLRAINKTRPFVVGSVTALVVNAACLWLFVPLYGLVGAMWSCVISTFTDALYLGTAVSRTYGTPLGKLLPWKGIFYVAIACAAAFPVIAPGFWVNSLGFLGVVCASALYVSVFAATLLAIRLPEAVSLLQRARRFAAATVS